METEKENNILTLQIAKENLNKLLTYRENLLNYYKEIKLSIDSLENLRDENLFLPIGNGIFVECKIPNRNFVIINIGSNVFLEMECKKAKEFLENKIKKLEEEIEEIELYIQNLNNYILNLLKKIKEKE